MPFMWCWLTQPNHRILLKLKIFLHHIPWILFSLKRRAQSQRRRSLHDDIIASTSCIFAVDHKPLSQNFYLFFKMDILDVPTWSWCLKRACCWKPLASSQKEKPENPVQLIYYDNTGDSRGLGHYIWLQLLFTSRAIGLSGFTFFISG